MIPKPSKERLSFVFYRENSAPKFFEIERSRLMTYLIVIPSGLLALVLIAVIGFSLLRTPTPSSNSPIVSTKDNRGNLEGLQQEKAELQKLSEELRRANQELIEKFNSDTTKPSLPLQDLSLFSLLPNQKDLSASPIMSVNEVKISRKDHEILFHANLLNTKGEENKVSGHLFLLMKTDAGIFIYPQETFSKEKFLINYTSGETVLFARLRLVDAKFPAPQANTKVLFKLLLFSRTGDLLHKETFTYEGN